MVDDLTRRGFLKLGGGIILFGGIVPWLSGCESNVVEPLTSGGRVPFITPTSDFFIQNGEQASSPNWQMPDPNAATHAVTLDGLVAGPRSFTLADLKQLAAGREITFLKTMQCVFDAPLLSGATGLSGNGWWKGVQLSDVLEAAGGLSAGAVRLRLHGSDGFRSNMKVARLNDPGTADLPPPAIVWEMNGLPLVRIHGAPFRLMIAESFGFKNVKWLERIEAVSDDTPFGTYQDRGFTDEGVLTVNSRSTGPLNGAKLPPGMAEITGVAISGTAPVAAVEISIDSGAWQAAEILSPEALAATETIPWSVVDSFRSATPFPWRGVWVVWRYQWQAVSGAHTLAFRARDGSGAVQPDQDKFIFDGTNGISRIQVEVA